MKNRFVIALLAAVILPTFVPGTSARAETLTESYLEYEQYRNSIEGITEEVGELYSVSPELLQAIIEKESRGIATAKNSDCCGLMQVSTRWHADRMKRLGVVDIYDPYSNVLTGCDYLAELREIGDGDIIYALLRYSLKTDTANRLYREGKTTPYVREVLARAEELEVEHEKI